MFHLLAWAGSLVENAVRHGICKRAGGGTVINARGTAREDDAKFFGVHIVPEKEMLMIVVPVEKRTEVMDAIQGLPCLSEPGSGIVFSAPVEQFTQLGKKGEA
mgnify:CR=1 FL=1